jgi:hypothetical protein
MGPRSRGDGGGVEPRTQSAPPGLSGGSLEQTCAAALNLYGLAALEVAPILDGGQGKWWSEPAGSLSRPAYRR